MDAEGDGGVREVQATGEVQQQKQAISKNTHIYTSKTHATTTTQQQQQQQQQQRQQQQKQQLNSQISDWGGSAQTTNKHTKQC